MERGATGVGTLITGEAAEEEIGAAILGFSYFANIDDIMLEVRF